MASRSDTLVRPSAPGSASSGSFIPARHDGRAIRSLRLVVPTPRGSDRPIRACSVHAIRSPAAAPDRTQPAAPESLPPERPPFGRFHMRGLTALVAGRRHKRRGAGTASPPWNQPSASRPESRSSPEAKLSGTTPRQRCRPTETHEALGSGRERASGRRAAGVRFGVEGLVRVSRPRGADQRQLRGRTIALKP